MRVMRAAFVLAVLGAAGAGAQEDRATPPGSRLDWYRWAEVSARPYMTMVRNLCDGDPATASRYEGGPEVGGTLAFAFPAPAAVTAFRFVQGTTGASAFRLSADADGDGRFETEIRTVKTEKIVAGAWLTVPVGRTVRGLEFTALAGTAGYRAPFPQFREVEIYTAKPVRVPPAPPGPASALTAGRAVPAPPLKTRRIENIVCTDYWHAGLREDASNLPEDLPSFKSFRTMVERLRLADADAVRIFSETSCGANRYPWPTDLGPHTEKNLLKAYAGALKKEGFRTYYFTHAWMVPFQKPDKMAPMPWRRWDYPYEQSDRLLGTPDSKYTEKYPCVICGGHFRETWFRLLSETVAQGVDGVYIMPDEYYFKGHNLPKTECPDCVREFKARFGYDALPPKPEDTERYRKWELFEYEKLNELFGDVAARLKKIKPNLTVVSNGNQAMVQLYNTRMEHGVVLDIQGRDRTVDAGDAYGGMTIDVAPYAAFCRRYKGAFGDDRLMAAMQWLNITYNETHDPIKFYGYLLPYVMEGARRISNYRLNYMLDRPEWRPTVVAGFQRMRLLEEWGVGRSRTPARVCVLLSRASEDWWQVKTEGLLGGAAAETARSTVLYLPGIEDLTATLKADTDTRTRELNYERFHGMAAGKCAEGILTERGIPYEVRYSDRPETLGDLARYRLVVLPFSYAMSREACAAVKAAAEAGTKLLIVEQLAPVNEYGEPHPAPLLAGLARRSNVVHEKVNLAREGMKRSVRERLGGLVGKLAGDGGIRFDAAGAPVEFLIREVDDGSRIVYLANWGHAPARPSLGLDLPPGRYRTTVCGGDGMVLREGLVAGAVEADAAAFRSFAVPLAPREVVLVRVAPSTAAPPSGR